jgi:hypothetical protein
MKTALILSSFLASLLFLPVRAESDASAQAEAPPLLYAKLTKSRDLGVWDDVFVSEDQEMIVLRRGTGLFALSINEAGDPKEWVKAPVPSTARTVTCARSGDRLWLFQQSAATFPFAVDATTGAVSKFEIPGVHINGAQIPAIQSHVLVPHTDSILLMIAGGDPATWPREGNHPIYFWMSLKSGKVIRFPTGWDLDYFSPDQRTAVFEKPQEEPFQRRPLQAVDMETGDYRESIPSQKEPFIPFDWGETRAVKPLYVRRSKTGDQDHFVGFSLNGRTRPFAHPLPQISYLAQVNAVGDFVGFRLRREGFSAVEPSSLWIADIGRPSEPECVISQVADFTILRKGNTVISKTGYGPKKTLSEAFFRAYRDGGTWNVLDGVAQLPELKKEVAEKAYVRDERSVRLIKGFGAQSPVVLCLYDHVQCDQRTLLSEAKVLERRRWRRAILVTSEGQRYMTPLFRDGPIPNFVWLHNSGKLFTGFIKQGQVQILEDLIQLPLSREAAHPGSRSTSR